MENFKCFRQISIDPKLVTLFIGPNGTGKSGVLQALLLLKQSEDASVALDLSGKLVSLSPDEFMLHGVDRNSNRVGLSISGCRVVKYEDVGSPVKFEAYLEYSHDAKRVGKKRENARFQYGAHEINIDSSLDMIDTPEGFVTFAGTGGLDVSAIISSPGVSSSLAQVLVQACQAPTTVIQRLRAVPAARGIVRQTYRLGSDIVEHISTNDLNQQENDVVTSLGYLDPVVDRVSNWMKQVTGVGFKASLVPSQSIRPVSITPTGEVSLVAEGFGTNSLIQLLLELARAVEGAAVLMEEPEIHLHPKAQAELASVVVEEAKASNKQVIMTTHSEHIAEPAAHAGGRGEGIARRSRHLLLREGR